MSSKGKIKKIIMFLLILIFLTVIIFTSSIANLVNEGNTSVTDLIKATRDESWYDFDPKDELGETLTVYSSNFYEGGYCIDPESLASVEKGSKYEIVNIFDINNGENNIKVYSLNKDGSVSERTYSIKDEANRDSIKSLLKLAYLTKKADEHPADLIENSPTSYKPLIARLFWWKSFVESLKAIGLSEMFQTWESNSTAPANEYSLRKLEEAEKYANDIINQEDSEKGKLVDITEDKDAVSVSTIDGKTFIGPYKLTLNGELEYIKVNGETVDGISTDLKTVQGIDKVVDGKEFYLVTSKNYDEITKVEVKSKSQIVTMKSRIALVGNSPSQNFLVWKSEETNEELTLELPVPKFGKIVIRKVDEYKDSNIKLEGIEFRLYNTAKGWVAENNGKLEFVPRFDNAKKYYTNKDGIATADKLPLGTYMLFETGIPEGLQQYYTLNYIPVPVFGSGSESKEAKIIEFKDENGNTTNKIDVNKGQEMTVTAENQRSYIPLVIKKVDKDTGKELDGIKFKIYRHNGAKSGWVQTDSKGVVLKELTDFEHATEYVSGVTAKFEKLPAGKYTVYETDLGPYSDMYDLGEFTLNGKTYKGREVETQDITSSKAAEFILKISNPQTKINISGFVWEEQITGKNTQTINSVYNDGIDKKIQGIEVRLIRDDGTVEQTTYTDQNGAYKFENVRIRMNADSEYRSFLSNYRIQFVYDGILYEDVISSFDEVVHYENASKTEINKTSSKVVEDADKRDALNNDFKEITGKDQVLPSGIKLDYNKEGSRVTLNNTAKRSEVSDLLVKVDGKTDFPVTAATKEGQLQNYLTNFENKGNFVKEITNINLGLYRREMPNIMLQKDTYKADVSVNGYTYSYMYYPKSVINPEDTTMGVAFEKDNGEYRLPIYQADVNYNPEDASKGLRADVMYRITLQNATNNLATTVNAIREAFPREYRLVGASNGTFDIFLSDSPNETVFNDSNRLDVNVKVDGSSSRPYFAKSPAGKDVSGTVYDSVITFKNPVKLAPLTAPNGGSVKYVYIKLNVVDIKKLYQLATEDSANAQDLENMAEISRYSVYEDVTFTKLYAGVDFTSIPNTMDPNNYDATKEDDTDIAQGLKIVDAGERTISGTVFEDGAVSEGEGKERIGNGIFDEGERTISGVKVELLDENGNIAKVYKGNQFVDAEAQNTTDGNFTISGFLPGKYKIVYTWGDNNYSVVDYKGTIYVDEQRANDVNWIKAEDTRYSDAMDDYDLRIAIDQKALYDIDTPRYTDLSKMKSTTPDFVVGIEKDNYTQVLAGDRTKYEYNIHNVDFGIIERPRQSLKISKDISSVYVTRTDGAPLIDAKIVDGKLEVTTGEKYVSGGPDLGYIYLQIDKEVTQGANAKLGYTIKVSNNSEIDYDDKDYYLYGKKNGTAIQMTLQAKEVYDYVKGSGLSSENTTEWTTVAPGDYKVNTTTGNTLTEDDFMENYNTFVDENGNTVQTYIWNTVSSSIQSIYTEWVEDMAQTGAKTVRTVKLADRDIIKYVSDKLTRPLAPGESETAEISTSKILAESAGDIRFDNDAEITDITYNTNQRTGRKPSAKSSTLYARGGWATVTGALGENRDYTWIIVTAVSAIAILGAGIVIIKKKLLK